MPQIFKNAMSLLQASYCTAAWSVAIGHEIRRKVRYMVEHCGPAFFHRCQFESKRSSQFLVGQPSERGNEQFPIAVAQPKPRFVVREQDRGDGARDRKRILAVRYEERAIVKASLRAEHTLRLDVGNRLPTNRFSQGSTYAPAAEAVEAGDGEQRLCLRLQPWFNPLLSPGRIEEDEVEPALSIRGAKTGFGEHDRWTFVEALDDSRVESGCRIINLCIGKGLRDEYAAAESEDS
jgi:hypothetical protein